jgi:PPK2 family polyphosphate:nucleotide phosphotransferase
MAKKSGKGSKDKGSKDKGKKATGGEAASFTQALRAGEGFELASLDPRSTPAFDGDKADGEDTLARLGPHLAELQERLYAESKAGGKRSLLLIIQGTDTSGKGGIMRHVVGAFDPQGVDITSFKAPTSEELSHPFLWRIRKAVPEPGQIGVFDRSQYEDVLIVRVHDLVPRAQWSRRYAQINTFEKEVAASGTTIIKVMLHISSDEQKERLAERLDRPDKHWKFNPADLDERAHWADYQEAYQAALEKCSTPEAPWFVVPADRKWYARLAVTEIVLEHLRQLDPQWPEADFDVEAARKRLAAMP